MGEDHWDRSRGVGGPETEGSPSSVVRAGCVRSDPPSEYDGRETGTPPDRSDSGPRWKGRTESRSE